nr:uncharacterized protein LOC113843461 [Anas platyrhynchos]
MSGKPPRRPRVAWVDSWATPIDESSYITPEDEEEEEVAVPRGPFDDLEVYVLEEEAVHTIDEFVKTWMEIPQGEEQKMKFLESICSVCTTARESGLSGGFADFCNRCNLCRHLQRLIEKEPLDQLETAVREQAMLAVAALSSLQVISEDSMQRLLTACFRSVFMLPPKEKLSARNFVMPFGRYLLEQQRTDLMLTCLEVVSHEVPEEDEQWVSFLLNAAREDPISWFASVPHFVIFFRKKLVEELTPAVRQKLLEVLVLMTRCYPHSVTMSILFICPSRLRYRPPSLPKTPQGPRHPAGPLNSPCLCPQILNGDVGGDFQHARHAEEAPERDLHAAARQYHTCALWDDRGLRNPPARPHADPEPRGPHPRRATGRGVPEEMHQEHQLPPALDRTQRAGGDAGEAQDGANGDYPAARRPENPAVRQPPHHGGGAGGVLQGPARPDEEVGQHHFPAAGRSAHALLGQRGRHGAGECHEALQRVHGARAVEAPQKDVEESAQRPADPLPPHERGEPERGQGLAAEHHRDQSEEKVYEIIAILEPMVNDVEPSVREETARTIRTVRQHLHWLQRPRDPWYMLAVHCCLPRRLWQAPKQKPEPEPEPQKNPEETSESEDSSLDSSPCQSTDS